MASPMRSVPSRTSTVATGPRPFSSLASMIAPTAGRFGLAVSSSTSAWRSTFSSKQLDALLGARRDGHHDGVAAPVLRDELLRRELLLHPVRVGAGESILLMATTIGTFGRLGVVDGLDGLGHHAVVRRHHQDDEVGDVGAAGAHGGERLVARRVEEGDVALGRDHRVGADVLGDAARLALGHVGLADGVEQRRLAVVDVAHHGDHRRPRTLVLGALGHLGEVVLDLEADLLDLPAVVGRR